MPPRFRTSGGSWPGTRATRRARSARKNTDPPFARRVVRVGRSRSPRVDSRREKKRPTRASSLEARPRIRPAPAEAASRRRTPPAAGKWPGPRDGVKVPPGSIPRAPDPARARARAAARTARGEEAGFASFPPRATRTAPRLAGSRRTTSAPRRAEARARAALHRRDARWTRRRNIARRSAPPAPRSTTRRARARLPSARTAGEDARVVPRRTAHRQTARSRTPLARRRARREAPTISARVASSSPRVFRASRAERAVDRASDKKKHGKARQKRTKRGCTRSGNRNAVGICAKWQCSRFVFFAAQLSAFRENLRRFSELFPNFS